MATMFDCQEVGCKEAFLSLKLLRAHYKKQHRTAKPDLKKDIQHLLNNDITSVVYVYRDIGDKGVEHLLPALMKNTSLTTLKLYGNKISDKGAVMLADVIKVHPNLTYLGLKYNYVGDAGAKSLAEAISVNHKVRLDCGDNKQMTDHGKKILAAAMATAKHKKKEAADAKASQKERKKQADEANVRTLEAKAKLAMAEENWEDSIALYNKSLKILPEDKSLINGQRAAEKGLRDAERSRQEAARLKKEGDHAKTSSEALHYYKKAIQYDRRPTLANVCASKQQEVNEQLNRLYPNGITEFGSVLTTWLEDAHTGEEDHTTKLREISSDLKPSTTFTFDIDHELVHPKDGLTALVQAEAVSTEVSKIRDVFTQLCTSHPEWKEKADELDAKLKEGVEHLNAYRLENSDKTCADVVKTHLLDVINRFIDENIAVELETEEVKVMAERTAVDTHLTQGEEFRAGKKIPQALKEEQALQAHLTTLMANLQVQVNMIMEAQKTVMSDVIEAAFKAGDKQLEETNQFHADRREGWSVDMKTLQKNHENKVADCEQRTGAFQEVEKLFRTFQEIDIQAREAHTEELAALLSKEKERQLEYQRQVRRFVHLGRVQEYEEILREEMTQECEFRNALYGKVHELDTHAESLNTLTGETLHTGLESVESRFQSRCDDLRDNRKKIQNEYADNYERFYELCMLKIYALGKQLEKVQEKRENAEDDFEFAEEQGQTKEMERLEVLLEDLSRDEKDVVEKLDYQEKMLADEEKIATPALEEISRPSTKDQVQSKLDEKDNKHKARRNKRMGRAKEAVEGSNWRDLRRPKEAATGDKDAATGEEEEAM